MSSRRRPIPCAVIGAGYWGPNIIRNLQENPDCDLRVVCDRDEQKLMRLRSASKVNYRLERDVAELWRDDALEAVAIATDIGTHYTLARQALEAGKHVFVEKPLATTAQECRELGELAERQNRVLMVGHTFIYNAAVSALKGIADSGELGDLYYLHAQRLNLGRIQTTLNALWSLAVHDIAIALHVFEEYPCQVRAWGNAFITPNVEDVVFVNLQFPSGRLAHLHASWLDPEKKRQVTLVGSRKMAVYDDVSLDRKLMLHDKGVEKVLRDNDQAEYRNFSEFQLLTRSGDVHIPHLTFTEPLQLEMQHFMECVQGLHPAPLTDWREGYAVVRILEAAQESLTSGGQTVSLDWDPTFRLPAATKAVSVPNSAQSESQAFHV